MMLRNQSQARREEISASCPTDRSAAANYRELFQIGSGGFATISVALAQGIEGFSKLVVLKTLREEMCFRPDATKMFMDEARLLARMNHPNIVQVYDVYRRRNATVIVMEYVDGQPLSRIRARCAEMNSPLSPELGISILIRVLAALDYAHSLCDFDGRPVGLVHRDISPQNVVVTYDGQVKLLDFGIAKLASGHGETEHTCTGVIKGKLTYMAPEQCVGSFDRRVDIFAVGVMLWELATRRRFWADIPEPAILQRLISGQLPHLSDRAGLDDDLSEICRKALCHDVEQRYASASEMQVDLERYLADRRIVVSQQVIGKLVSETCMDERERVQEAIRCHVSENDTKAADVGDIPASASLPPPSHAPGPGTHRVRSKLPVLLVIGAAAAFVGAEHFRGGRASEANAPSMPHSSATGAALVRLRATAQPEGAVWYLDDRRLGPDPLEARLPRDDAAHLLRAELDGYAPFTRAIRIETDIDVATVLAPRAPEAAQPAKVSSPPVRRGGAQPRGIPGPVAAPLVATAAPVEGPRPPTQSSAPRQEGSPTDFGETLKRSDPKAGRDRPAIDMDYPGGGG